MLILSLAMENDWDDLDEEVVIVGFIIALFLTHISSITGAFIGFTKDIKHVTDDVSSIDDDMNDVYLDNTFTDSTLTAGKGNCPVAPSADATTKSSDETGNSTIFSLVWMLYNALPYVETTISPERRANFWSTSSFGFVCRNVRC